MSDPIPPLQAQPDTVAELRDLYRSAEARAARLRLLIESSRDLSAADAKTLPAILSQSARRAAHFAGSRDGEIRYEEDAGGIGLFAPGAQKRRIATLQLSDARTLDAIGDSEDREALSMMSELMAATIQRVARERENETLLQALQEREQKLEQVIGNLFSAQEEERRRVSRDLHDGVAQTAGALFRRLEAVPEGAALASGERSDLVTIAQTLIRELRLVIAGLRPTALDDLGLLPALRSISDGLREDGYEVVISSSLKTEWPAGIATAFYRIAQEALTNVRKHAGGPCRIDVTLSGDPALGSWIMKIRDFGVGLGGSDTSVSRPGERVGVEMMRERMTAIGGSLDVTAAAGGGVEVTACIEGVR